MSIRKMVFKLIRDFVVKHTKPKYEEPCEITGGACEWVYDYANDDHEEGKPLDYDLDEDDVYCRNCYRWRDWDKLEFPNS